MRAFRFGIWDWKAEGIAHRAKREGANVDRGVASCGGAGFSILGMGLRNAESVLRVAGYEILDDRYRIPDAGYSMLDTR